MILNQPNLKTLTTKIVILHFQNVENLGKQKVTIGSSAPFYTF